VVPTTTWKPRRPPSWPLSPSSTRPTNQTRRPGDADIAPLDALPYLALNVADAPEPLLRRLFEITQLSVRLHDDSDHVAITIRLARGRGFSWVGREIDYWRTNRERDTFLIVLTSGKIVWDEVTGDFNWEHTTALPSTLRGWFSAEPLWVDLSWARDQDQLSVRHSRFRSDVATLAPPVHGKAKEELDS
jgi:hypothetical protein